MTILNAVYSKVKQMRFKNITLCIIYLIRLSLPSKFQKSYLNKSYISLANKHNNFENLRLIIGEIAKLESRKTRSKDTLFNHINYSEIVISIYQQIILYIFSKFWYRKSILISHGLGTPILLPLKSEWTEIFKQKGFRVNSNFCTVIWYMFLAVYFTRNLTKFFENSFTNWKSKNLLRSANGTKIFYFYDFPDSALQYSQSEDNLNFLKWFLGRTNVSIAILCSNDINNGLVFGNAHLYGTKNLKNEIKFIALLISTFLKLIIKFNFKFLAVIFLNLNEVSKAFRISIYQNNIKYSEVIFNASLAYARPLWSVALSKINIKSTLYFYASNSSPLSGDFSNAFLDGWQINSWDNICVIDEHQGESIKNVISNSCRIDMSANIPMWTDQKFNISDLPRNYILVFDNNLNIFNYNFGFLAANGADSIKNISIFFDEIIKLAYETNSVIVYKHKRPSKPLQTNQIEKLLSDYENVYTDVLKIIRLDIAPHRLIHNASFVLAKPISTTLLIAKEMKKPCAYFDNSESVSITDPELRDIKVVRSYKELEQLINES